MISFIYILFSIVTLNASLTVYGTQIIGLLIVFFSSLHRGFNIKNNILFLMLFLLILITSLLHHFYSDYTSILWLNALRSSFWIFVAFNLYNYLRFESGVNLNNNIKKLIYISGFFVYLQFILFYVFKYNLDLSVLVGGLPSRSGVGDIYRPVGLTTEPSIQCGFMIGLLTLNYILEGKQTKTIFFGLISLFFTMSIFGILSGLLFLLIINFRLNSIKHVFWGGGAVIIAFYLSFDILYSRLELFMNGSDGSNNIKLTIVDLLFNTDPMNKIGFGFVGKDLFAPRYYEALYDMTYPINLLVLFGPVIGAFLLFISIYFLYKMKFSIREKLLVILTLLKVSSLTSIFFPCFICLLFVINSKKC